MEWTLAGKTAEEINDAPPIWKGRALFATDEEAANFYWWLMRQYPGPQMGFIEWKGATGFANFNDGDKTGVVFNSMGGNHTLTLADIDEAIRIWAEQGETLRRELDMARQRKEIILASMTA